MNAIHTRYSDYEWVTAPAPDPVIFGTNGTQPKTDGIDVSRYQDSVAGKNTTNYRQCYLDGVKFAAIRCTVGDYYTDPRFAENWEGFQAAGILRTPYVVVAPAWSPEYGYHPVSAQAHWDEFKQTFGDRVPDLPIALDCELDRNMSPAYISALIDDLIGLASEDFGRMPIIYTRGNWWNSNTISKPSFGMCDLWIARYNQTLATPWSDNEIYRPRDWHDWHFWQYSEEGEIDGIPDSKVDLDWFNGTLEELLSYADGEPIPPPVVEPPASEILYTVKVVNCTQLRIRRGSAYPAYLAPHDGYLFQGAELDVLEEVELANGSICCRFSGDLWAWRKYNGYTYLQIV